MLVIKLDSSRFSHSIILESFSLEDNKKAPIKGAKNKTYQYFTRLADRNQGT